MSRCGALASLEGLVRYLGIHTNPDDPAFCHDHRAQLCYVAHVISLVLKNSVTPTDTQPGMVCMVYSSIAIQHACGDLWSMNTEIFVWTFLGYAK